MNFVISYWVPPGTRRSRLIQLRRYFDLQVRTKRRFGADQLIVSNLDWEGLVPFAEPPGWRPEHAILSKWLALGQLIEAGLPFPITMTDHDVFQKAVIPHDTHRIRHAFGSHDYIADQIVIVPAARRDDVMRYVERLRALIADPNAVGRRRRGPVERRHEGRWSSESVQFAMTPRPFADVPHVADVALRDLVSFDIGGQHSLDAGVITRCNPIGDAACVHGHLNKGRPTELLLEWLETSV